MNLDYIKPTLRYYSPNTFELNLLMLRLPNYFEKQLMHRDSVDRVDSV